MKINNKGMTLTEVIAALIILSIVMIFLFNILSDLRYEDFLSSTRNEDAVNRASLINLIENDFITKDLYKVTPCIDGNNICLTFDYRLTKQKTLIISETYVAYGPINMMERWDLANGKYDLDNFNYCLKTSSYNPDLSDEINLQNSEYFSLKIFVPVIDTVSNSRKADIDLTYIDKIINHQFPYEIYMRDNIYNCEGVHEYIPT